MIGLEHNYRTNMRNSTFQDESENINSMPEKVIKGESNLESKIF